MKFTYSSTTYRIEFERKHRMVSSFRNKKISTVKSKHPFTTVKLLELQDKAFPKVVESATVGCALIDNYSNENGRLAALRSLTSILKRQGAPQGLRAAIWECYLNRDKEQGLSNKISHYKTFLERQGFVVERKVTTADTPVLLPGLPPASEEVQEPS